MRTASLHILIMKEFKKTMGTVNLGQVAALIQSVSAEPLENNATPTVKNVGTKANAKFVFGIPTPSPTTDQVTEGSTAAITSGAMYNTLNNLKVISIEGAKETSIPLADIPEGAYLTFVSFLYQEYMVFYFGVLLNFKPDAKELVKIVSGSGASVELSSDNTKLNCNFAFSSVKFIKVGYW